jgi:photosystem II stability/assembly factor-like uncharacterized protein
MSDDFTLVVGTVGSGVFHTADGGNSWTHSKMPIPYGPWSVWVEVRCVALSTHDPRFVLAGSHIGLNRSSDGGRSFEFVRAPFDNRQIWSAAVHPEQPDTFFVGIAPFDNECPLWRTNDGGKNWTTAGLRIDPFNKINGAIHVTGIAFHPQDPKKIFCTIEVGGLFRSSDGGDTWVKLGPLGDSPLDSDIHNLTITANGSLFATSPMGLYRSADDGETFTSHRFDEFGAADPIAASYGVTGYARGITFNHASPNTIYVGIGDNTPGVTGAIMISRDDGISWSKAALPVPPNSHIYCIASHPANPDRVVAATIYGYLYISEDGGATWNKHRREFGEIRGLAWLPS